MVRFSRLNTVKIPDLITYSQADLDRAKQISPAVARGLSSRSEGLPLTQLRRKAWLEAALATLLKRATPLDVTWHWSNAADQILRQVWQEAGLDRCPAALLALGKLGAQELNLSSDVDLVIISQPNAVEIVLQNLRTFQKRLTHSLEGDWLLRLDFDLRPGGRFGPVVATPGQLRDYYWSQGETWERLAWVRARPICGPSPLVAEIFEAIEPFCFRRFLDFGVTEDLKLLRQRIHAAQNLPDRKLHLKLGRGGIRDIELFVHSLLIIHGGRRPELRTASTSLALERLQKAQLLPEADALFLIQAYWRLREWENALQAVDDQQTHILNLDSPEPLSSAETHECQELCCKIDLLVSSLLGPVQEVKSFWPEASEDQFDWLVQKGISRSLAQEVWPPLLSAVALSGKSERDELARRQFLGRFIEALQEHRLDANLGLQTLFDFVKSVRAKASLFNLLLREPRLIRDLAHLFSVSPYLGQMISSRPELLDSFLIQRTASVGGSWSTFLDELVERRQLCEILAAGQFLNSKDTLRFGLELSDSADSICDEILSRLKEELGPSTLEILKLGKWGGRELGVRSDLDFIMLTKAPPSEIDQKIARRLITRLTENHRGGRLYAIDLRLRPSGNAGPLLQSEEKLIEYLSTKAVAWERQSYLRARASSPALQNQIRKVLLAPSFDQSQIHELRSIREKLLVPFQSHQLNLKSEAGGLIQIEFSIQLAILLSQVSESPPDTLGALKVLTANQPNWAIHGPRLEKIYLQLRLYEQLQQLTGFHSGSQIETTSQEFRRLAQLSKLSADDLQEHLRHQLESAAQILQTLDPLNRSR